MAVPPFHQQLWNPRTGIVFTQARAREPVPLYPRLDMTRLLHSSTFLQSTYSISEIISSAEHDSVSSNEVFGVSHVSQGVQSRSSELTRENVHGTKPSIIESDQDVKTDSDLVSAKPPDDKVVEKEPPVTSLEYNVSEEAFRSACKAAAGTPESFWSYTLYRGPAEKSGAETKVKVHYCKSKHTMERVSRYFSNEPIIGFDLEWSPDANKHSGIRRNVSLIQMASPSRIALFHIALFPKSDDFVAPTFRAIMEDPEISKVGVAVKADCTRLRNFLGVATRGIFELSHMYKLVKYSSSGEVQFVNKRLVPLATQVEEYLRLPMFKGQDVRASDWSQSLNMSQIICTLKFPILPSNFAQATWH
jgi:exonuclease 3'-5' domain-containing protein 2